MRLLLHLRMIKYENKIEFLRQIYLKRKKSCDFNKNTITIYD